MISQSSLCRRFINLCLSLLGRKNLLCFDIEIVVFFQVATSGVFIHISVTQEEYDKNLTLSEALCGRVYTVVSK